MTSFTLFPALPLEIRREIWSLALPGPRVLLVKQQSGSPTTISRAGGFAAKPTTSPASYGGHHPTILSVNRESRAEALLALTPLFGAFWNLEIDAAYFELPEGDSTRNEVFLIPEMRKAGLLDAFKHIAIDWLIWEWESETCAPEFTFTYGASCRDVYEHPIQTLNSLPNLKTCTFVHLDHTLQQDLIAPYSPWYLGPLTTKTTLDANIMALESAEKRILQEVDAKREEIDNISELEIKLLAIHNRKREDLQAARTTLGVGLVWLSNAHMCDNW